MDGDIGAKYENLIAISLLKHIFYLRDYLGQNVFIQYLRTKDGREVDFLITENNEPLCMIEAKYAEKNISKNLKYFNLHYNIPGYQVVFELKREYESNNIQVQSAENYLNTLSI